MKRFKAKIRAIDHAAEREAKFLTARFDNFVSDLINLGKDPNAEFLSAEIEVRDPDGKVQKFKFVEKPTPKEFQ